MGKRLPQMQTRPIEDLESKRIRHMQAMAKIERDEKIWGVLSFAVFAVALIVSLFAVLFTVSTQ